MVISTTRIAPVGSVLPSSASADVVGQPVGHDAGADHGRHQHRRAERFGGEAARQIDHQRSAGLRQVAADLVEPLLQRQPVERVPSAG